MSWPAYPDYKDSGVDWLGEIPAGWSASRLKYLTFTIPGGTPDTDNSAYWSGSDDGIPWVSIGDMSQRDNVIATKKSVSIAGLKSKGLHVGPPGTVLFAMYASVGEVSVLRLPAAWNQALLGFEVNESVCSNRFLFYSLVTVKDRLPSLYRSNTQNNLNADQVENLALALPGLTEQDLIADFLDEETAKIGALIDKQNQLIATLREERTATITHAVTKGLNPEAELKESGVEWLGRVPSHWTTSRIEFACKILTGFPFKSDDFVDNPDEMPLLRGANVAVAVIDWTDVVYWPRSDSPRMSDYALAPGDIVMGLDRPFISSGIRVARVRVEDTPSLLLQRVARLRSNSDFDQDFVYFLLTGPGIIHHLTPIFTGVSVPHVSPDQVGDLPIPRPPLVEQRRIVTHLKSTCETIDSLIAKSVAVVAVLREYRSALITAAVTGKIDVRKDA